MHDPNMSPQESLLLIRSMIEKTRENYYHNRIYFLVWGWLTFFAFSAQFILKHLLREPKHYLVWLLLVPAILFSVYQGSREKRERRVKTYVDEGMAYLWVGLAISFCLLGFILSREGWSAAGYPFYILLYGLGTFISGRLLRFIPLVIGGIVAWGLALGCVFVSHDFQLLFGAAAILFSYIIPAYLMRKPS